MNLANPALFSSAAQERFLGQICLHGGHAAAQFTLEHARCGIGKRACLHLALQMFLWFFFVLCRCDDWLMNSTWYGAASRSFLFVHSVGDSTKAGRGVPSNFLLKRRNILFPTDQDYGGSPEGTRNQLGQGHDSIGASGSCQGAWLLGSVYESWDTRRRKATGLVLAFKCVLFRIIKSTTL